MALLLLQTANGSTQHLRQKFAKSVRRVAVAYSRSFSTVSPDPAQTTQPATIRLFQYAICPFCNKSKAFLDYSGLQYESIEVNPLSKNEIKWSKDYRKVPIATVANSTGDAEQEEATVLKGSDEIVNGLLEQSWVVDQLESKWSSTEKSSNMTFAQFAENESARQWIDYTNKELAVLLYPNLCPTLSQSYQAFEYVNKVPSFSPFQRFSIRTVGALAMYLAAFRVKKKHSISDERVALDKELQKPVHELEQTGKFLSGQSEPHLGDLAVFGAFRGLQGTEIHREILQDKPVLAEWYQRVDSKLQK